MPFLVWLIVPVLINIVLGVISYNIEKNNEKELIKNLKNEHIVIRHPKAYSWVGYFGILFFSTAILLMVFFPNDTADTWVWVLFSGFVLLSAFLVFATLVWKMEIFKSKDYFFIRTVFCRKYKVQYSDCISYKFRSNSLVLKTNRKTFYVDCFVTNFEFLLAELDKHNVREIQ